MIFGLCFLYIQLLKFQPFGYLASLSCSFNHKVKRSIFPVIGAKDQSLFISTCQANYDQAGRAIGQDLVNNPDLVAIDATISFKTTIWFWMTPQGNKPSSHDVIIGQWMPLATDTSANRQPSYGVITNIINGGVECGKGQVDAGEDRIGFYRRYCGMLNVAPGDNLDCYNQKNFAQA